MTDTPDENVVVFQQVARDIARLPEALKQPRKFCLHCKVFIHPEEAKLECQDCGAFMEPYGYLRTWARERHRPLASLEAKKADIEREIAELSDTCRKLRGEFKSEMEHQAFARQIVVKPPRKAALSVVKP